MKKHNVEWWFTDAEGRRIGWLWPEDLEAILEAWYGKRKWVNAFCDEFDMSRSQVDRYRKGLAPIPKTLAMLVLMLSTLKNTKTPLPDISADWLPDAPDDGGKVLGPLTREKKKSAEKAA